MSAENADIKVGREIQLNDKFKQDIENIGEEGNQITTEEFLEKYGILLRKDIDAFCDFLSHTEKIQPDNFKEIRKITQFHIKTDIYGKNSLKLFFRLSDLINGFSEKEIKNIYKLKLKKGEPKELRSTIPSFDSSRTESPAEEMERYKRIADQIIADVLIKNGLDLSGKEMRKLAKELRKDPELGQMLIEFTIIENLYEKLVSRMHDRPDVLIRAIEIIEKQKPEITPLLIGKIRRYKIDDKTFLKILEDITEDKIKSDTALKAAITILSTSIDRPFKDIVSFKKIANKAINGFNAHGDMSLIQTILERGYVFLQQDKQTKKEIIDEIGKTQGKEKILQWIEKIDKEKHGEKAEETEEKSEEIPEEENEETKMKEIFDLYIKEIEKLMDEEKFDEAFIKIVNGLQLYPEKIKLYKMLEKCIFKIIFEGEQLQYEKKYEKALEYFNLILRHLPANTKAIKACIICNTLKNKHEAEIEGPPMPERTSLKSPEMNEKEMEIAADQIRELMDQKKFKVAKLILNELRKKDPNNPGIIHALGECSALIAQEKTNQAIAQLYNLNNLKTEKEKWETAINILPILTEYIEFTKEYIGYKKYLLKNKIGKDLIEEDQIFTALTEAFKISKIHIKKYLKDLNKWIEEDNINLTEDQRKKCADFFRAEAELINIYYPERKYSIWDLYTAESKERKRHIIEDKEGIPVKIDTIARIEMEYENTNPIRKILLLKALSKDEDFKKSADGLLGTLYSYRKNNKVPKDFEKTFLAFKTNIFRTILNAENDKKFEKICKGLIPLIKNKKNFLDLSYTKTKNKNSELPRKQWGKESIDPTVELIFNFETLDCYLNTIRLEPDNIKNYEMLLRFIKKIKLIPQIDKDSDVNKKLKEIEEEIKKDSGKASQKLFDEIDSAINLKKTFYMEETPKEKKVEIKIPENMIIDFGPVDSIQQTNIDPTGELIQEQRDQKDAQSGIMLRITTNPTSLIEAISRKLKGR